jgi:hypothetical protein
MRRLLTILLLFLSMTMFAQNTVVERSISGAVAERNGEVVAGANVLVQSTDGKRLYSYGSSDGEGRYEVRFRSDADSVRVAVTGFNLGKVSKVVPAGIGRLDFVVEYSALKIKEVKVEASAIERKKDTVSYYVANFKDSTDRSIGDVLQKLPGIEVAPSGQIKYQGKAINKFYVEGLDMLGSQYGIATNNIQASDIAKVEVYEDHQPIKVLQDWVASDRAAINLILKSGAKGAWNGVVQAGAGYQPVLWNGEVTPMFFGKNFQTIMTYKTNNTGDDVARELESSMGLGWDAERLTGIQEAGNPPVNERLYLNNNIHSVSINTINKTGEDSDLTVNAYYIHDNRNQAAENRTSYFIPGQNPLDIYENIDAESISDRMQVALQFRNNANKNYLNNRLSFNGSWNRNNGVVRDGNQEISQVHRQPRIAVDNDFRMIRRFGKWQVDFVSNTDYNRLTSELQVKPMVFSQFFDEEGDGTGQHIEAERFRTENSVSTSYRAGFWNFYLKGGVNAHIENLKTVLSPLNGIGSVADSLMNDCRWRRFDVSLQPQIAYSKHSFNMSFVSPLELAVINGRNHYLARPSVYMNWKISYNLKMSAYGAYNMNLGDLYDSYSGYIMRDYRFASKNEGNSARTGTQNYGLDMSYSNPASALFASADVSYFRSSRSQTVNNLYEGDSFIAEAIERDNVSSGLSANGRISKRFSAISTTISLNGGWSRSWSETMAQGEVTPVTMDRYNIGGSLNSNIGSYVIFDYSGSYSVHSVDGYNSVDPVGTLKQNAALNFVICKRVLMNIGAEHYFCGEIQGNDRNMVFMNASASYKFKKFEFVLEGRNLLDKRSFSAIEYSDTFCYAYAYELRPLSVMFKVRFSLR